MTPLPPSPPYQPAPADWLNLPAPVRVTGTNREALTPSPYRPPDHDPKPEAAWWLWPESRTAWALPWLPLPDARLLAERGPIRAQVAGGLRGDPRQDVPSFAAWLWEALGDLALNFRLGGRPEGVKAIDFYPLLPQLRWELCVRVSPKAHGPASLARPLARLRTLVAMCDPEDESDPYWCGRVRTFEDFTRALPAMKVQVQGGWVRRETAFMRRIGGEK